MELDDLIFAAIFVPLFFIIIILLYYITLESFSFNYQWRGFQKFFGLMLFSYYYHYNKLPEGPTKFYFEKDEYPIYTSIEIYDSSKMLIMKIGRTGNANLVKFPLINYRNGSLELVVIKVSIDVPEEVLNRIFKQYR